jgi:hypothetical protein
MLDDLFQLTPQYPGLFGVGIDAQSTFEITFCFQKVGAAVVAIKEECVRPRK